MNRVLILILFNSACALAPIAITRAQADGEPRKISTAGTDETAVASFLQSYCMECHAGQTPKGEIPLGDISIVDIGNLASGQDAELWEQVLGVLEEQEMPPEDAKQPTSEYRDAIVNWIRNGLQAAANRETNARAASPGIARRLTNLEYQNTMRDLLGVDLHLIDNLPKDPTKPYRFNNTPEFMRLGPEQINRYLECSRRAMASVIVDPEKPQVEKTRREWKPHGLDRGMGLDEVGVWGNRRHSPATGMGIKTFPATGEFRIRMQASAILPEGINELPLRLVMGYGLNVNSATQRIAPVGTVRLTNSPDDPQVFEFRGRIENHPVQVGRVINGEKQPDTLTITPQNLYDDGTLNDGRRDLAMPRAVIEWIEFEAPVVDVWPPKHHSDILFESTLRTENPAAYIRTVLKKFMSRAFRRRATAVEVERFAKIYEMLYPELETLEAAMRETLAMVLISPQFLYHTESNDGRWAQYELASKLSYFLWASTPDAELLKLASDAQLSNPSILEQQVLRLLADERSDSFVENFANQWLSLDKLKTVPVNQELYPRFLYYVSAGERRGTEVPYRPTIRDYMLAETTGFITELIRRNASVLQLVDSDFAYINQPLAAHYGVEGVRGDELRPVAVKPENQLGGLLTQGSILIGNGTGTAPHPIYRAVWLREAILGDEVPPPPADVPALSDSAGESAETALNIGELLQQHRQKESCNDCHSRLDPLGLPFEHHNAIGKYQAFVPREGTRVRAFNKKDHLDLDGYSKYLESIATVAVDASSKLPQGPQVTGMRELKDYLIANKREQIASNMIRRLLGYALGRELNWRDRFQVEYLRLQLEEDDYRLRDMIVAICQSEAFLSVPSESTRPTKEIP
ncbi:MAG: DUF1592 domain-containing protein [Planctomycetota bacterium]